MGVGIDDASPPEGIEPSSPGTEPGASETPVVVHDPSSSGTIDPELPPLLLPLVALPVDASGESAMS
jgi:hypothetical protein